MRIEFCNSPLAMQVYRDYNCGGRFVEARLPIKLRQSVHGSEHVAVTHAYVAISESGTAAAVLMVTRRDQADMGVLAALGESIEAFRESYLPDTIAASDIEWFHVWEWTEGGHYLQVAEHLQNLPSCRVARLHSCQIPSEPMSVEGWSTGDVPYSVRRDAEALDDVPEGGYRGFSYHQDGLLVVVIMDASPAHRRSLDQVVRAAWSKIVNNGPEPSSIRWYLRSENGRCKQLPRAWAYRCGPGSIIAHDASAGTRLAA